MRRHINLLGMVLALSLCFPLSAFAARAHGNCDECHKVAAGPRSISNVCIPCHDDGDLIGALGKFTTNKASDALKHHPLSGNDPTNQLTAAGAQTAHFWGGVSSKQIPAGSAPPPSTFYKSSMNISTGLVTCSICHDPHGQTGTKLLRKTTDNDLICQQCHTGFYVENPDALMTHPIGYPTLVNPTPTTYADAYAADTSNPKKFKDPGVVPNNATQGITLINGYVSCSSCHAVHFADSDSSTPDGRDNVAGLNAGDGHLLKADGPTKANKSALCQTCHTYQRHGNPASLEEDVGCLVCHSGHVYNGATPNYFVLRNTLETVTFGEKTNATYWPLADGFLMNKQNGTGFCERCHGVSSAIPFHSLANGGTEDRYLQNCKDCHKHNEAGFDFSWKWSGNSNLCGDCHGFPPYLNVEGDYKDTGADVGTKGGFAVMDNGGSDDGHSYATSGYSKSELLTPHKSHAGGGEALGAYIEVTDYKFAEGQGACTATCHDLNSHKQVGVTASFRDIVWGPIAKGNIAPNAVNLSPVYTTTGNGSCGTVYCHSNGGARPAGAVDRAKISTDFKFAPAAPAWGTGDADIIGVTAPNHECAYFCHGNSAATMATGTPAQLTYRNNSVSHIKHLNKGYTCNVCHKLTAGVGSNTVVLDAARLAPTGTHVNGKPDVGFDTTNDFDPVTTGTQLNIIKPASGDNNSGYTSVTGVCNVYCHSDGKAVRTYTNVDWDQASTGACGTCHQYYSGGVPTGSGAALSATHAKHFAIAVALTCNDCHGTNASAGTHTGHVDTVFTTVAGSCNTCHGIDGVEAVPQWNAPMSNDYCISCHTGVSFGNIKGVMNAPNKEHAKTRGHNATANYTSGNLPGNKLCTSCHLTSITNHVNVTDGDATHLAAAATTCTATCHGPGGSAVGDNTKGIVSHFDRACKNCHDPHGDTTLATNIYMIRSVSTGTGNYSGAVDFRVKTGSNSYDEVDAANADDLCATCHTYGTHPLSTHNTKTNQGIAHHEGENCMTAGCHRGHTEPTGAFVSGGGTQCNDCHGNPPVSNAQLKTYGQQYGAHAAHTFVGNPLPGEDRTDCELCHPGAATYSLSHSNGGGAVNLDPRIVAGSLGGGNYSCATFNSDLGCHASSATDGYWTDVDDTFYLSNGLNCTACHNASGTNDGVLANAAPNSGAHAKHKVANKTCTDCHNNGVAITDTTHINSFGYAGAADDGAAIVDKATATLGEGAVLRNLTTYDQVTNFTCTGGIGLACHNSKVTPNWRTFTNITCTNCHNPTTSDAADPKTGLHNIGVTEAAAGVKKHDSTLGTNGCTECHNSTKPATHANGIFLDNSAVRNDRFLTARAGGVEANWWADSATANRGTCFGTAALASCHSDGGNWTRLWSTEANSTATASGSARCNVCHGQYSTLSGSAGLGWNAGTSHYKTYGGATSTRGVTHKSQVGENNACEDCHSYTTMNPVPGTHDTATHQITMNDDAIEVQVTEAAGIAFCDKCHDTGNPLTSGTYSFTQSIFPIQRVDGTHDPKQECNNCHGNGTGRYWPIGTYGAGHVANDGGRHEIHLTRLAKAKYNMTVDELLVDPDVKNKQIELCYYCHNATVPGVNPGHNDTGLPAEVSSTMYALWDTTRSTADAVTYTGNGNNGTGTCAAVNCHNNKNTDSLGVTFYWHASGTQNCTLCHNDIASGATGTTHQVHIGAGNTIFGKTINCSSCHGGSPTWEGDATPNTYTVPATNHIDGQFRIGTDVGAAPGATVSFGYSPNNYVDIAAHTFGSCAINLCHNNGKNGSTTYTWGNTITGTCTACHDTSATLLAEGHDGHLLAATTFGKTISCEHCHEAVSSSNMTGKSGHMDGFVTLLSTGMAYSGIPNSLNVTIGNNWGQCTNSACHRTDLSTPKNSPAWNTTASGCSTCHGSTAATLTSGRHEEHLPNAYVLSQCGLCHAANLNNTSMGGQANHMNASVNMGGTKTVVFTTPGCTNTCHKINAVTATYGDWLDAQTLACVDCHEVGSSLLGESRKPLRAAPNGLHKATVAQVHNQTLAGGCNACHTGVSVAANTPPTHMNNLLEANTDYGLFGGYSIPNGTCVASCHSDGAQWSRKWIGVEDATPSGGSGQAVCNNCHGQFGSWNAGTVHYRSGSGAGEDKGTGHTDADPNQCQDCHGYPSVAGRHNSNDKIDFSGNGSYTLTWGTHATNPGWFCLTGSCHTADGPQDATASTSRTYLDSVAFPSPNRTTPQSIAYVDAPPPTAGCAGCHINVTGEFWPDGAIAPDRAGQHPVHVREIAKKLYATGSPSIPQQNDTCNYCHPANTHGGTDAVLPADVSRTDLDNNGLISGADPEQGTYMKRIVTPFAPDTLGFWRRTPGTCSNVACHARGPYTPHWYGDTTKPNPVTTLAAAAGTEPGSVTLTWLAKGDDADLDGIAYRVDVRMSDTNIANETDFDNAIKAPGIPSVRRAGNLQTMVVRGLPMGALRYFAVRTIDKAGNASLMSNVVSRTANTDNVPPVFGGIDAAIVPTDASGTVLLDWAPAEDHSMPLSYKVWYSNGTIDFGAAANVTTTGTSLKLEGLNTNGDIYEFAVRACDFNALCDDNSFKKQAIPKLAATLGTAPKLYYANGSVTNSVVAMNNTGYTATGSVALTTGGTVFVYGTGYTYPVNIYGNSFAIYLANTNGGGTATAELGSVDSTGAANTFVSLATSGQITLASKAKGIKTFKFNGGGGQVAATRKLAVKVVLGTGAVTASWGSIANAGALSLTDQFVNSAPTSPGIPVITGPASGTAGVLGISWTPANDITDGVADTVHYDVYGSINGGSTFPFVIAKNLSAATTSTTWNTIEEGLGVLSPLTNVVQIRVQAGDGYTHSVGTTTSRTINNTVDVVAPAAASNFIAETRPKSGSVYLSWTAPGDDGVNNGRASSYDIRWSTSTITDGLLWDNATPVDYEPYPDFGGETQHYEVLNLNPGTNYYFAIKASDGTNLSPIAATSVAEKGGPNCGGCHATPPSESGAVGNHERHGFTLNDCAKCHGDQVKSFTTAHQDGDILYGYNNNVYKQNIDADTIRIFYTVDGTAGGTVLYEDINGSGGFNPTGTGQTDSGTCMNWSALGISGCHGPAGTDPDGAGTKYPLYTKPEWRDTATLTCSNCHGNSNRTVDPYGRAYNGGTSDQIKSSPAIDNHGYTGEGADFTEPKGKYVGQHEKHLNYSFRLSKGDSCNLCHKGKYTTMGALDGKHANGEIDIELDLNAAGPGATWLDGPDANTAGSCSGMSQVTCHPGEPIKWSSTVSYDCIKCHFMNNIIPQHVTDPFMGITDDVSMTGDATNTLDDGPMAGNCTWCHFAGHPQDAVSGGFMIPNNPIVGINYKSGGIHLRNNIGGRTAVTTEAQLCWGCHYSQTPVISEWGADSGKTNTWSNLPGGNIYNFGTLTSMPGGPGNWVGASWQSGTPSFVGIKDGTIKSTHATGGTWTATVTSDRFRTSTEANDAVGNIRCSNCHDVHNLNLVGGGDTSPYNAGNPYLRGTWLSNPYKEDGPPLSTHTFASSAAFGAVPRGGTGYVETGGYYIDQNSGNPTATYSLATSAGLCVLCHGENVNDMDKVLGENLWLTPSNGHSNSTIGGTGSAGADIFSYAWRNPTLAPPTYTANYTTGGNPNMGYQNCADYGGTARGDGFRSAYSSSYGWLVLPAVGVSTYAHSNATTPFDWGVTQNTGTVDPGYHNFSCSKCHNPHASRLPKLMITNCLDTSHNTWDNTRPTGGLSGTSGQSTALATDNVGRTLADTGSAQNCHRFSPMFSTTATNISFPAGGATIQSVTAIFTAANKYHVNDRIRITGGVNAGKVGKISSMTTTVLTLTDINDANGNSTTLTQAAAGPSITLTGARGGWNKITPW